jgi:superfamily II DNA or RNA helicase
MKLFKHEQIFLERENNDNEILAWQAGTGKTHCATLWLEQKNRLRNAVVICPKQIREKWKRLRPEATVYSFEDFLKADLPPKPSAIVIDEADCMASPLFVAKLRSKRTEKLYNYILSEPDAHTLQLTATPVRSSPWNMHTLLTFKRHYIDWKKYRQRFFSLESRPYLPRPAWLPIKTWRKDMQRLIEKHCHVALMRDLVDEMPPETHEIVKMPEPDYEVGMEWEPMRKFVEDHRLEQQKKPAKILELSREFSKVLVVAHYTDQIDNLESILKKDRPVYVLDGRTKNADKVITEAEEDPECFFIVQASVGAGFEVPSFDCMIFASMGFSVRNYVQMMARIQRANALHPVIYYYLLSGRADRAVYGNIQLGKDFVPSQYLQYATKTTP